jgi:hypothetical protein
VTVEEQLAELRTMVAEIRDRMGAGGAVGRAWYSVEEAAALFGKRPYTVREWCREGRIHATKRIQKSGRAELWSISAEEVARVRDEGLLPLRGR